MDVGDRPLLSGVRGRGLDSERHCCVKGEQPMEAELENNGEIESPQGPRVCVGGLERISTDFRGAPQPLAIVASLERTVL